jgi:phage terminase Nu1 subunit (DNA packaging protein)
MSIDDSPIEMTALDVDDVAQLLCVSPRMIRNYIKENDLPCRGDGRGRRFAWPDVLEWFVSYRLGIAGSRGKTGQSRQDKDPVALQLEQMAENLRKTTAEADRLELKLAQERGEVVATRDVEASIAKVASSIKTAILAMPAKLANRVYGVKDKGSVRSILDREARDLCARLATIGQESAPKPAGDDADD